MFHILGVLELIGSKAQNMPTYFAHLWSGTNKNVENYVQENVG